MKNMKRILLTMVAAMLLVVMSVAGTLAYLVSTSQQVTNTFSVGKVKIDLDEAIVDEAGVMMTPDERTTENTYHLMPGHGYTKDPTVHIADDSEDAWLYVKIVNEIADIEDDSNTIAAQMAANGWTPLTGVVDKDGKAINTDGIYVYKESVSAGDDITVFESFAIDGDVTKEALAAYEGKTIKVQAYAVQVDMLDNAVVAYGYAPLAAWETGFAAAN